MKKQQPLTTDESMEEEKHHRLEVADTAFNDISDICQQLLDRYGKSSAPQHRHLCATAAATRSIIQSESLPLTPLSYFAATIDAVSDSSKTLDANTVSALSSFLAIVLPLIPETSIGPSQAADAVSLLFELVEKPCEAVSASSVRALVKCLGVLVEFCDLEDWESVKLGFQTLLKFSIDKRPKVRKCAQDCVVKVFKSFESSLVKKRASKLVLSLFKSYMLLAVYLTASRSVDDVLSKPEHLEVLHMLNVMKHLVPYLSVKVRSKAISELQKLLSSKVSSLTRHIFDVIEVILQYMEADGWNSEAANIVETLDSYINLRENPVDTVLSAATLLENVLCKLYVGEPSKWSSHLSLVIGSIAGLLTFEATASRASNILKELISRHIDRRNLLSVDKQLVDDEAACSMESSIMKSTCAVLLEVLTACSEVPNEHIIALISLLFLKLGEISHVYMKDIIVKLANFTTVASGVNSSTKHLQECFGSAIVAMGPEKLFSLLPISLNDKDLTCSNIWLIPILKNYVAGSSLGFFMEHVVPLAESFQRACEKVRKSVIGQDLQAHAHACWGLLPAFCRYPNDTYQNFGSLTKLLIPFLKKDSFMLENVAMALQELVNQNRRVLSSDQVAGEASKLLKTSDIRESASAIEFKSNASYSKKIATRNIKALASCSEELLQALRDALFESPREKHMHLKDTIGCLASITDSSVTKKIFISSLERFELLNDVGECGMLDASVDKEKANMSSTGKNAKRCLILELASSIIGAASEDLIDLIFNLIRQSLQEADEIIESEAYVTLNKVLEESSWFCSSKSVELMDLLLGLKSPVDITSLKYRFACFKTLLVHSIERSLDGENTNAFLILNEIILTLKDSKEEGRKVAYDIILGLSSILKSSSCAIQDGTYHKLISMIMGYLSGSSPHIKSGAVSALSVVVYNDSNISHLMPDLVPSVLELLHSKAVEVIKAVLGFVKVLVLSLQVKDLLNFLSDIVNGVLPWSSVSRHHFRSKVTVILEIMMRRCGSAVVKSLAPDKYRDFVKSVLENRRGKTSYKEAVTTEVEQKNSDSTPRRWQKRKHGESGILLKEEDSTEPRKRREDRRKSNTPSSNEPRRSATSGNGVHKKREVNQFGRDLSAERQPQGSRRNERKFNSVHSGGKGKNTKRWERNGRKLQLGGRRTYQNYNVSIKACQASEQIFGHPTSTFGDQKQSLVMHKSAVFKVRSLY